MKLKSSSISSINPFIDIYCPIFLHIPSIKSFMPWHSQAALRAYEIRLWAIKVPKKRGRIGHKDP